MENFKNLQWVTCEGLICEFHRHGFCDRMIATMLSTQFRLWEHVGKPQVSEQMKEYLHTQEEPTDFLEELFHSSDGNEDLLFGIESMAFLWL